MGANTISCDSRTRAHNVARRPPLVLASSASGPFDLRRKRAARGHVAEAQRELADLVVQRADHLPVADAALVLAVYRDGKNLIELATLARPSGDPEASSIPHLRRRLRRITERCVDPIFAFVAARRESLPPTMRRVATACVLHGMSVRRAALALNLSNHAVRRHRESLQAIFNTHQQAAPVHQPVTPAAPEEDAR